MKRLIFGLCALATGAVAVADVITPPFSETFDNPESYNRFTIIDANKDDVTFEITEGAARVRFSQQGPTDDWLVLPPLQLKGGRGYTLSFDSYGQYTRYPEKFEVMMAEEPTAAALSAGTTVVERTRIVCTIENPHHTEEIFTPAADGTYYIGIHGCSDEEMFFLYIDNIEISEGISSTSPGPVTDADIERDPTGALSVTIRYTAPRIDFSGAPLTSLDGVRIYRDNDLIATQTPAPGEVMTFTDDKTEAGEHTYTLIPFNGDGEGESVKLNVFAGFNRPETVTGLKAVIGEHDGQALITWSPVTADITGVTYPDGAVTYNLLRVYGYDQVTVAEGLTDTSYRDDYCRADSRQAGVYYTVVPVSDAGEGAPTNTPYLCLGAPYTVPFTESFVDGEVNYEIWITDGPGAWSLKGDYDSTLFASQDGDNGLALLYSTDTSEPSEIITGRISLADLPDAVLTFHTLAYSSDESANLNRMEVAIDCGDGEGFKTAASFNDNSTPDGNSRWILRKVELGKWAGKDIRVAFRFITVTHPISALDNIVIKGQWESNLSAVKLSLPATLTAGIETLIPFTLTNLGTTDATGYTLALYRDGEIASTIPGPGLSPGETVTVEFAETASSMWNKGVTYFAVVDYDADGEPSDNVTEEIEIGVRTLAYPVPGTVTGSGMPLTLSWEAPVIPDAIPVETTDDLSSLAPFSTAMPGSVLGSEDNLGDWSVIDGDGLPSIKVSGADFPNTGTPMAFIVFNGPKANLEWEMFEDHGGDGNMFISFCAVNGRNDDWIISPRLSGTSQSISFHVKAIVEDMPEMYEVYYSTTGKEKDDFKIIRNAANAGPKWEKITVSLPEGARYFAVRYCSLDHYGLLLDDFTFTPEPLTAGLELMGYNLYRNGRRVNDAVLPLPSITDVDSNDGDTFCATALYNNGESAPSEPYVHGNSGIASIGTSTSVTVTPGMVNVISSSQDLITVTDIAGRIRYRAPTTGNDNIALSPGLYILSLGTTVTKIAVP